MEAKAKVIWASRHALTAEQIDDAGRIWPGAEIEARNVTFRGVADLQALANEPGVVAVVAVMPQALAMRVGYLRGARGGWVRRVYTAVSVPAHAVEGETRQFAHAGFVDSRGEQA